MGSRQLKPLRGFGLVNKECAGRLNLATPSEADPQQGSPVPNNDASKMTIEIHQAQGASIDTVATAAGMPHVSPDTRGGLALAWRTSETSPVGDWTGWNEPGVLHKSDVLTAWSSTDVFDGFDTTTIRSTQKVIAIYFEQNSLSDLFSRTLDPANWTWVAEVGIRTTGAPLVVDGCCCSLEDVEETVIVMENRAGAQNPAGWIVHQSIDAGATWVQRSDHPFDVITNRLDTSTATASALSRVEASGDEVLFVRTGTGYAVQYASVDGGGTFAQVSSDWTVNPPTKQVLLRTSGGGFGMVSEISGAIVWHRLGSAFQTIETTATVQILGATCDALTAWPSPDGNLYAAITQNGQVRLFYSINNGTTWVESGARWPTLAGPFNSGDASTKFLPAAAAMSSGRVIWLGNTEDGGGGTTYDGMVTAVQAGGWSNVETAGWYDATAGTGRTWLPFELPDTIAPWTPTGSGTATLIDGHMNVTTAANGKLWRNLGLGTFEDMQAMVELEVNDGGLLTAQRISVELRVGNGTGLTNVEINFTTTQYTFYDRQAGVDRGAVTHGVTGRLQVLIYHSGPAGNGVSTWYKAATSDIWILGHDDETAAEAVSVAASSIEWGHIAVSNSDVDWYQMHFAWSATAGALNPRVGADNLRGKALSALPVPLPTAVADDGLAAFISVTSGGAILGETHDIDVTHPRPKENMFVDISPDSGQVHRTAAFPTGEVLAKWLVSGSLGNSSIFLYAENINYRTLQLHGSTDGGATFPTLVGTLDAQIAANVPYIANGYSIEVDPAGSGNHTRYIDHGELVGGTVELNNVVAFPIVRNTEGVANADNPDRQWKIWFDPAGAFVPAPVEVRILAPRAVLIVHDVGEFNAYQVTAPTQFSSAANDSLDTGRLVLGSVHPVGKAWTIGYSRTQRTNTSTRTTPNGTTFIRENGVPVDTMVVGWQHGADRVEQRASPPSPDFLAADTGPPLATVDDVFENLKGVVEYTESGRWPVILFLHIPDESGTTLTDPSMFHPGNIVSPIAYDHVTGDEGVSEYGRTENVTVRGLP